LGRSVRWYLSKSEIKDFENCGNRKDLLVDIHHISSRTD
jgi:hypothetical protein